MTESKAMIVGLQGLSLSEAERAFIAREKPWGLILFARNVADGAQLRELTDALRAATGRSDLPILIDQEGGRVQRLKPPLAPKYPPAARMGALYREDRQAGLRAAWLMSRLHAFDLLSHGINVDCLPVLDVPMPGSHDVIGDRAYGNDPETVEEMARAAMEGLAAGGVLPIVKHIPGHGRAGADSHLQLPVVTASRQELERIDFRPFRTLNHASMAMTAHVVYADIDPDEPATTSPVVISDIIRNYIGFDGLLMSDDVSMKALSGDFASRTDRIFAAGCDLVLHCNGDMAEMEAVAARTPVLEGAAARRADAVTASLTTPDGTEEAAARAEFDNLLAAVA